jgi:hypothetical protein
MSGTFLSVTGAAWQGLGGLMLRHVKEQARARGSHLRHRQFCDGYDYVMEKVL